MEWVALILWAVIAALALALAAGTIAQLAFGVQAAAVLAAFGLVLAFIVFGGAGWMAWAAFGCAVVAAIAVAVGSAWLVSSDRLVSHIGQGAEEAVAAVAGIELPLLGAGILINLSVALGLTVT